MKSSAPAIPPPVDPMAEARAQLFLEQERATLAQQQAEQDRIRQEQERAQQLQTFNSDLDAAINAAMMRGQQEITQRGLDPTRFNPLLETSLQDIRGTIPELSSNVGSFFDAPSIVDDIVGRQTDVDRRNFNQQLNSFAGQGFANNLLPDTMDDAIIDDILASRFADASSQIQRARDRGNLTDFGFDTALANLQEQRTAGASRLQDLGMGLLQGGRDSLRTIRSNAEQGIGNFRIGDSFSLDPFRSQIDNTVNNFSTNLRGRLTDSIGSDPIFDVNSIIARGGIAQGAQNAAPQSNALLSAFAQRQEDRTKQRGIGNQGSF